jgi:hypothetical protein
MQNKLIMIHNEHFLHHGNHAGVLVLKNGQTANYGSIRVENGNAIFWSGKGLREVWKPDLTDEQKKLAEVLKKKSEKELIESDHIMVVPLSEIEIVLN